MRSHFLAALAAVALWSAASPLSAAPKEEPLARQVNDAIKEGVKFLRGAANGDNWELDGPVIAQGGKGGETALVMLALLNAGVLPEDPYIKKGLNYLRGVEAERTYALSLQTMVFILAGQDIDKARVQKNVDRLVELQVRGAWGYNESAKSTLATDNSNTQYALLAIHEAVQAGYKVDRKVLEDIQTYYKQSQHSNGTWSYTAGSKDERITMTTAGLCGLYITGMDLGIGQQKLRPDGIAENCGKYAENKEVARAIDWLSNHFPSRLNDETIVKYNVVPTYYALYGIERAGRLSGQRFLGDHDWYRIGCEFLVKDQKKGGKWEGPTGKVGGDSYPVVATSFALLFLSKGRTPVLLTKLAYGNPNYEGWNNKRNDVRNMTEFASRNLFNRKPMAWQVFDVRNKTADGKRARQDLAAELLQSPVVYFNGHAQVPGEKEEEILQEYLENGGFLFVEACCGREEFDRQFRAMMKRMFPDNELAELSKDHPVWRSKFAVTPRDPFPLYGIDHGCKTVVIYSPRPISGYWEQNEPAKGNGKVAFELGANIIAYATGLEPPKYKGEEAALFRGDADKDSVRRGYLKVAQLKYGGGDKWQPAPNAMRNLMNESRKVGLDVVLETKPVHPSVKEDVDKYRFFYLHGREAFQYDKADLKDLRFKLETGGTLLADACCGSKAFDDSFRKFIDDLFDGKAKLVPIPQDDKLFGKNLNGEALNERTPIRCRITSGAEYVNMAPSLEGVLYKAGEKDKGRWIVIYSKYDLGCALEHGNSPDCLGYTYDSAVKIGRAAVLYHLNR
jgi:hypothetical protein